MKVFTLKKEFKLKFGLSKTETKKQYAKLDKEFEKCVDKVMDKAFKYLRKNMCVVRGRKNKHPKTDLGTLDIWTYNMIHILDDRFWCKKSRDDKNDEAIFEKVISVGILDAKETSQKLVTNLLKLDTDAKVDNFCTMLKREETKDVTIVK